MRQSDGYHPGSPHWYFVKRVLQKVRPCRSPVEGDADALDRLRTRGEDQGRRGRGHGPWGTGQADDAAAAYEAARKLAQAREFPYRPAAELAAGSIDNLLTRLEALVRSDGTFTPLAEASALHGAMDKPPVSITAALAEFVKFTAIKR